MRLLIFTGGFKGLNSQLAWHLRPEDSGVYAVAELTNVSVK